MMIAVQPHVTNCPIEFRLKVRLLFNTFSAHKIGELLHVREILLRKTYDMTGEEVKPSVLRYLSHFRVKIFLFLNPGRCNATVQISKEIMCHSVVSLIAKIDNL